MFPEQFEALLAFRGRDPGAVAVVLPARARTRSPVSKILTGEPAVRYRFRRGVAGVGRRAPQRGEPGRRRDSVVYEQAD
ncbi:hypothetical protein ACG83_31165 [Frankia sp. R43]|nr:hypothetical protein ACG83_31165 [Frankia sp. R43]